MGVCSEMLTDLGNFRAIDQHWSWNCGEAQEWRNGSFKDDNCDDSLDYYLILL